jgi:tetratricopeptide (TPR) repeat protein
MRPSREGRLRFQQDSLERDYKMTQAFHPVPGASHPSPENYANKVLTWAKAHQEMVFVGVILLLIISICIPYVLHSMEQSEKDAQNSLNLAQFYLQSPVDAKNGTFKSDSEKYQQSLQSFHRITTDYAGTKTAKTAQYFEAKCQYYLGQYPQAYASFDTASQTIKEGPLGEEAKLGKILCLEAQNQWPQAITLLEAFLRDKPQSFLTPEIQLHLAEAYLNIQNKEKALEELKIVSKQYADTNWGKEASRRLAELNS